MKDLSSVLILAKAFCLPIALFCVLGSAENGYSDDWLQFRGPGARGVSNATDLPDHWGDSENVRWKTPIDGRGWSSPIVVGKRVFVTTVTRDSGRPEDAKPGLYFGGNREKPADVVHQWKAVCLNLTNGHQLWSRTLHEGKPKTSRHIKNSYASETPVSDGKHVFITFGDVGMFCLTLNGETVWEKELPACETRFDWGTAASPALHDGRLYFVSDSEDDSYLSAIDTKTGEQIWRVERDEKSNWATPFIWTNDLRTEIVTPGTGRTRSYDLSGKLLYEFGGCSSITIATPYSAHGLLFVTSGYVGDSKRPVFAIRPGATGDISLVGDSTSNDSIAWSHRQAAPYNPSTIVYRDQLYVLHDRSMLASYDARTGEVIYEKKRLSGGKSFTSSPWAYNDRIFCLNEFGKTIVIKAGREFEQLHSNELESKELCMATPAVSGNQLVLRTGDAVFCIAKEGEQKQ